MSSDERFLKRQFRIRKLTLAFVLNLTFVDKYRSCNYDESKRFANNYEVIQGKKNLTIFCLVCRCF